MGFLKRRRARREMLLQKRIDCMVTAFDAKHERQLRNEMEENGKLYDIVKIYANSTTDDDDPENTMNDIGLVEVALKIFLKPSDWYKLQSQSFYQELIQYLDNLQIQQNPSSPEEEKSSAETEKLQE